MLERYVAALRGNIPDRLSASLQRPLEGNFGIQELERSVKELGLRGLKMHPTRRRFFQTRPFYPLWKKCAELGIPVLFHTGQTGVGARTPVERYNSNMRTRCTSMMRRRFP